MPKNTKCNLFHPHQIAYRTVESDIYRRQTYRQKYCIRCKREIGLSEIQKRNLKRNVTRLLKVTGYVLGACIVAAVVVCGIFTLIYRSQQAKLLQSYAVMDCYDYGKALGYQAKMNDENCIIYINDVWVTQSSYEKYIEVKSIVEE